MSDHITIRVASEEDATDLAALSGELGYPVTDAEMAERLERASRDAARRVVVAQLGARAVAWMELTLRETIESGATAEITGLVVAESQRGRGIGRALVEHGATLARGARVPKLRVRTNEKRAGTHSFYESCGFTLVKSQRVYDLSLRAS